MLLSEIDADNTDMAKLGDLLGKFGEVNLEDKVEVTFKDKAEAEEAVKKMPEVVEAEMGLAVRARLNQPQQRKSPKRNFQFRRDGNGNGNSASSAVDFPLRILVKSEMVGAIIGRGGQTIRQITQQTRARVDVHRKETTPMQQQQQQQHVTSEKAITIYGQPENCTNACKKILEVMLEEAKSTGKEQGKP